MIDCVDDEELIWGFEEVFISLDLVMKHPDVLTISVYLLRIPIMDRQYQVVRWIEYDQPSLALNEISSEIQIEKTI